MTATDRAMEIAVERFRAWGRDFYDLNTDTASLLFACMSTFASEEVEKERERLAEKVHDECGGSLVVEIHDSRFFTRCDNGRSSRRPVVAITRLDFEQRNRKEGAT